MDNEVVMAIPEALPRLSISNETNDYILDSYRRIWKCFLTFPLIRVERKTANPRRT